jgi:plastocyanin
MKKINRVVIATSIFFAILTGCKKADVTPNSDTVIANAGRSGTSNYTVEIANGMFNPRIMGIVAGNTVTWVNNDASVQTVTADDESFDSGDIQPGQSWSLTTTVIGQHTYHSRYNTSMTATLNVAGIK